MGFEVQCLVFGEGPQSDVHLSDENGPLIQFCIEKSGSDYILKDLNSESGTYVNGQLIQEHRLSGGDIVSAGSFVLMLEERSPAEIPTPPVAVASLSSDKKSKATFAPESTVDGHKTLEAGHGPLVKVDICWEERVIHTEFFNRKSVIVGSAANNDLVLPMGETKHTLISSKKDGIEIHFTSDMSGYILRGDDKVNVSELDQSSKSPVIPLRSQEKAVVQLGRITLHITFSPQPNQTLFGLPLMNLTISELAGLMFALVVSAIFWIYMLIYVPDSIFDETLLEEPIRKARVTFTVPNRVLVLDSPETVEIKNPQKDTAKIPIAKKEAPPKKKVTKKISPPKKLVTKKVSPSRSTVTKRISPKKGKSGKARAVKPNPKKNRRKKTYTSARSGGAVKTGRKKGGSAKSVRPDPTKVGLLGVFGSGGKNPTLDKAYSGSGELVGAADQATGAAGFNQDREGKQWGTKTLNVGAGGKGTNTVGISGVGTKGKGRGYGLEGDGTGSPGVKSRVNIDVGGDGADIVGSLDREAIRRVIRNNRNVIKYCYEKQLNRDSGLFGKIVFTWEIASGGQSRNVSVKQNTMEGAAGSAIAQCIASNLKSWRWPDPPTGTIGVVTFPFVFSQ